VKKKGKKGQKDSKKKGIQGVDSLGVEQEGNYQYFRRIDARFIGGAAYSYKSDVFQGRLQRGGVGNG